MISEGGLWLCLEVLASFASVPRLTTDSLGDFDLSIIGDLHNLSVWQIPLCVYFAETSVFVERNFRECKVHPSD